MSFNSIAWNGYGVVTYCDGTTDTAGGAWAELGGGTFSYNTDTYLTGLGSIGSQYANKSGYTHYTAITSFDFTSGSTGSGTEKVPNQYFYIWINLGSDSSVDILANDGLSFMCGSSSSNNRHWKIAGSNDSNGWGSGWKLFIIDPTTAGSLDNGTYDSGNISTWGLWIDTIVSVRAETIFIDQIAVASGVRAHSGTGTLAEIITYCYGELATRVIGSYTTEGRFNFVTGPTIIGDSTNQTADTALTASSQINGYNVSEYYNGSAWVPSYPVDNNKIILEKHASYTTSYTGINSSMFGNSAGTLSMIKDSGATYTYSGGTFEELAEITHDSDWDVQGATFASCASRTITGGTFDNNTINTSDPIILSTIIDGCKITNHITNGVETPSLNNITNGTFERDTAGYAVVLPTISTNVGMNWACIFTGYIAGSSGTDVGVTPTSAEAIYVDVDSGITLTINVADGATIPSVANAGLGQVDVVAGQKSKTFTGLPTNTEVRVRKGSYTLAHEQNVTSGSYSYTYTPDSSPARAQFTLPGYIIESIDVLLDSTDQTLPVTVKNDPSYQ